MNTTFDPKTYGAVREGWRTAANAVPPTVQQTFLDAFFRGDSVRIAREKADISFEAAMGLITLVDLKGSPDQLRQQPPAARE